MNITLHKNARTTPAVRAELQSSTGTTEALAKQHGCWEANISRRKSQLSLTAALARYPKAGTGNRENKGDGNGSIES